MVRVYPSFTLLHQPRHWEFQREGDNITFGNVGSRRKGYGAPTTTASATGSTLIRPLATHSYHRRRAN